MEKRLVALLALMPMAALVSAWAEPDKIKASLEGSNANYSDSENRSELTPVEAARHTPEAAASIAKATPSKALAIAVAVPEQAVAVAVAIPSIAPDIAKVLPQQAVAIAVAVPAAAPAIAAAVPESAVSIAVAVQTAAPAIAAAVPAQALAIATAVPSQAAAVAAAVPEQAAAIASAVPEAHASIASAAIPITDDGYGGSVFFHNDLSIFLPWPLRAPSAQGRVTSLVHGETYGKISNNIREVLKKSGYKSFYYFIIPRGFAITTPLERINKQGLPQMEGRWTKIKRPYSGPFLGYFQRLLSGDNSLYRTIIFTITPNQISTTSQSSSEDYINDLISRGRTNLPRSLAAQKTPQNTEVSVLIYEFSNDLSRKAPLMQVPNTGNNVNISAHLQSIKLKNDD